MSCVEREPALSSLLGRLSRLQELVAENRELRAVVAELLIERDAADWLVEQLVAAVQGLPSRVELPLGRSRERS